MNRLPGTQYANPEFISQCLKPVIPVVSCDEPSFQELAYEQMVPLPQPSSLYGSGRLLWRDDADFGEFIRQLELGTNHE